MLREPADRDGPALWGESMLGFVIFVLVLTLATGMIWSGGLR